MSVRVRHEAKLVAANLALDFINTASGRHVAAGTWVDDLDDGFAVLAWLRSAKAIDEARFGDVTTTLADDPAASQAFWQAALRLREALRGVFHAAVAGQPPGDGALMLLNDVLAAAHASERLVWTPTGMKAAKVASTSGSVADALWPIALAAEDILAPGRLDRVKQCQSSTCDWLFLDTSKNGSRCWCQMRVCGNREKGRRRLKRQRAEAVRPEPEA